MPIITNASSFTVIVRASKVGYKTESSTQTTKVNKANGSLSLSSYSGTITYPNSTSFTASGTGSISAWSSNTGVATVSVSGNTVTIKSIGAGSATITVKSASNTNYNEKTVAYAVTVKIPTFTGSSGVGYYADVDGNGTVDGVIFVDRKNGASGSWGSINGDYSIDTITGMKQYYVSKKNYSGKFGTKDVLSPMGSGNARFYAMALNDVSSSTYTYEDAQKQESNGWYVPSRNVWAAFGGQLKVERNNYNSYGLKSDYWTSTLKEGATGSAWSIGFNADWLSKDITSYRYYVRLYRTF